MTEPANPIAAAIHPDPYPYYARLATEDPLHFDVDLGCWVAASREAVEATLQSPLAHVRPSAEPVPATLDGSVAGEVFRRLVRMNDGPFHAAAKPAVQATLCGLTSDNLEPLVRRHAARCLENEMCKDDPTRLAFALPAQVLGEWLGLKSDVLPELPDLVHDFVRAIGPGATPEQAVAGIAATGRLRSWITDGTIPVMPGLTTDDAVANAIGFLFQAYDATAGLIGNTLLALGGVGPAARTPGDLRAVVEQVARLDPAIQNTRRFVVEDGVIAGQSVRAGDAILVLLAAANHDPRSSKSLSFGMGPHACPGERIATTIAVAAVESMLAHGVNPSKLVAGYSYLPLSNARIPLFQCKGASG